MNNRTAVDHFEAAAEILRNIERLRENWAQQIDTGESGGNIPVWLAEAQVHATLALASAQGTGRLL